MQVNTYDEKVYNRTTQWSVPFSSSIVTFSAFSQSWVTRFDIHYRFNRASGLYANYINYCTNVVLDYICYSFSKHSTARRSIR